MVSFDCLWPCGLMVSFGNVLGLVELISLILFVVKGFLFLIRFRLDMYMGMCVEFESIVVDLFKVVVSGVVKVKVNQMYPL